MATQVLKGLLSEVGRKWAGVPRWLKWGSAIGLVQVFAVAVVAPLGVSTAYPQIVGLLMDKLVPGFAQQHLYLREIGAKIGWEIMIVVGMFVGALLSHLIARVRRETSSHLEPVLVVGFEGGRGRGYMRAFLGGFLCIFGARLANGCTTGHMLSGMTQLAVSGLVFGAAAFGSALILARLLYHERTRAVGRV